MVEVVKVDRVAGFEIDFEGGLERICQLQVQYEKET